MICNPCKEAEHDCCREYAYDRFGSCDCQHVGFIFDTEFPRGWMNDNKLGRGKREHR